MTLRKFLELKAKQRKYGEYTNFTFTVAKSVKDDNTPFYHDWFRQTPVRDIKEWLDGTSIDKYIVINPDSMPIDITGNWCNWYKRGDLVCCIVTTIEDLELQMKDKDQLARMIKYYNKLAIEHFPNNVELYFEV
jgi:hypothetical protein